MEVFNIKEPPSHLQFKSGETKLEKVFYWLFWSYLGNVKDIKSLNEILTEINEPITIQIILSVLIIKYFWTSYPNNYLKTK